MSATPAARHGVENLVPFQIHLERILASLTPLGFAEYARLADAAGRTLAASVDALVDLPPFDNSAMDGYAVRRTDVVRARFDARVVLEVIADLPACAVQDVSIGPGQAARIMTGAPIPVGADAVVPAAADEFAIIPEDVEEVVAGDSVEVMVT